jgi:hypothetical protein
LYEKDVEDTLSAMVFRQIPPFEKNTQISKGIYVDLFFTNNQSKVIIPDTDTISE